MGLAPSAPLAGHHSSNPLRSAIQTSDINGSQSESLTSGIEFLNQGQ
jgi:hypothetical protein